MTWAISNKVFISILAVHYVNVPVNLCKCVHAATASF